MSSSDLIRWSGLAAMVGGALWAVGAFFDLMYFSPQPMSEVVPTSSFLFQQVLYLLGATLLLIGLVELYARQSQAAGALGLVGFLIAFAENFAAPEHGRYVSEPARFDERGVAWLPPAPPDPLPKAAAALGMALLAGTAAVTWLAAARRRGQRAKGA